MTTFKDTTGRTWSLGINVAAVKRVRKLTSCDLFTLFDEGMAGWGKLVGDVVLFVDVLYVLVMEDAERWKVTDEQFGASLGGDAIADAMQAFAEALVDFFPDPKRRKALQTVMEKAKRMQSMMLDRASQEAEKIDPAKLMADLEKGSPVLRNGATSSPASADRTPTPSPSES